MAKRILYLSPGPDPDGQLQQLRQWGQVKVVSTAEEALESLCSEKYDTVIIASDPHSEAFPLGQMFQAQFLLTCMPEGVVLLDRNNTVLWANEHFRNWCQEDPQGKNFYRALGSPEIIGPDFCPLHTALSTRSSSHSVLKTGQGRYLQLHARAFSRGNSPPKHIILTLHDVTEQVLQQQKLEAIHRAGIDLADLKPEEHLNLSVQERIELLKAKIIHYTQDLLHYDTVEIRLLDKRTGRLELLLSVGMDPEAAKRELFAKAEGNGVTGFVAATGKSYLCENTEQDPLYLPGAQGAKSSMTVPLVLHDEVIGTFNVESPKPRAFDESDLQFLEIFSRDVAMALNTLELLAAEKASTAQRQTEATFAAVALPIDEILNDAVNVIEQYIGHDPEVVQRLQRIAANAREVKTLIQKVGEEMTQLPPQVHRWQAKNPHPELRGRQVLVADADEAVRSAAHQLLERYGCVVETARGGKEALRMVRNLSGSRGYDCIIADIRLPDMNGYELMCALKEIIDPVPLVLMTGFGYDPTHSIVRARQAGLKAVLYKPFRVDQLLETVGRMVLRHQAAQVSS